MSHTSRTRPSLMSNRKFQIVTVAVFVGILLVGLFVMSQPQSTIPADFKPLVTGAPRLAVLSDEIIDHGDVQVNTFVESEFIVQNVGDQTLFILGNPQIEVIEGCCPSQTSVDDRVLSPGEITTIRTRFTMHPGMDGQHEFRVHVVTDDPLQKIKELTILSNWIS